MGVRDDGGASVEVVLFREGRHWIAQSMNIDYCAYGETAANARQNFLIGLEETLTEHARCFGDVSRVFVAPPAGVTNPILAALAALSAAPPALSGKATLALPPPLLPAAVTFQHLLDAA